MPLHRLPAILALLVLLLGGQLAPAPEIAAGAAQPELCFAETNECIRGRFLEYWLAHGGLAINGYPLTAPAYEQLEDRRTYLVQWFERARFELHPENAGTPYEVLLGQFGRIFYPVRQDQPWSTEATPLPGATYFAETGHNLRGPFRAYWEAKGGLPQFGFPLTEEIRERLEDGRPYTVQYFERARFEYHPENQAPYDVLLGQFGRRILAAYGANRAALPFPITRGLGQIYENNRDVRVRLGLPTGNAVTVAGAFQPFEYGLMLYRADTRTIYVSDGGSPGNWSSHTDEWDESQPVGGGPAPTPGHFLPARGFGKLWREREEVRQRLGYSWQEGETHWRFVVQPFAGGLALEIIEDSNPGGSTYGYYGNVFLLYNIGRSEVLSGR